MLRSLNELFREAAETSSTNVLKNQLDEHLRPDLCIFHPVSGQREELAKLSQALQAVFSAVSIH